MDSNCDFFDIKSEKDFEKLALDTFYYQYNNNNVYNTWCKLTNTTEISSINDISFLPISFFKTHKITSKQNIQEEDFFLSSGTTSMQRSRHNVYSKNLYIKNTFDCFSQFYGDVSQYCYLCLLPNYLEQQHSSLICMMNAFIGKSRYKQSGFFKDDLQKVTDILESNEESGIKTVLFGVTYALLDLIEQKKFHLQHTTVFETGGMKGRRKEMAKSELHNVLKQGFGVENIHSEYGMCELFSQAYSLGGGRFATPKQMKVFIKETNDYKSKNLYNRSGIINIIDLANRDTCSFIQTEDIGRQSEDGCFEIIGRLDHSALRGCNLMYNG